jgi:hydrogenase 3 maturation protease
MENKKISNYSWLTKLQDLLALTTEHPERRVAIMGVGREFNGDDAVGIHVIRQLRNLLPESDNILLVEACHAPENCTGLITRFLPDLVIIIDAAQMDKPVGTIACINHGEIDQQTPSTHNISLSLLAGYLAQETHCQTVIIGIQSQQNDEFTNMTDEVQTSSMDLTEYLAKIILANFNHISCAG